MSLRSVLETLSEHDDAIQDIEYLHDKQDCSMLYADVKAAFTATLPRLADRVRSEQESVESVAFGTAARSFIRVADCMGDTEALLDMLKLELETSGNIEQEHWTCITLAVTFAFHESKVYPRSTRGQARWDTCSSW
jgi:hypothetical protein